MPRKRVKITDKHLAFLDKFHKVARIRHLAVIFNCDPSEVKRHKKLRNLVSDKTNKREKKATLYQLQLAFEQDLDYIPEIVSRKKGEDLTGSIWSEAEENLLRDLYGLISIDSLQTRLRRKKTAIRQKAKDMRLDFYDSGDEVFKNILHVKYGVDCRTINRWIEKKELECRKVGRFTLIKLSDIDKLVAKYYPNKMFRCQDCGLKALKGSVICKLKVCENKYFAFNQEIKWSSTSEQ